MDEAAVGRWHREVFGEDCPPKAVGRKLLEESAELFCALAEHEYSDDPDIAAEIGDVMIMLLVIADRCGLDVPYCFAKKFEKVTRKYAVSR